MDDTLEIPRPRAEDVEEGDDHSSGDEDGGLDWTRLPKFGAAARPIIPKRGEKDFEPAPGGGSGLQLHVLDRSRDAMFDALRANRAISRKTISYGIWHPSIDRVHVTTARGMHFSTIGYSISRNTDNEPQGQSPKLPKRLELFPEEALYLIERGALLCYKSPFDGASLANPSSYDAHSPGAPMSVHQAFAELIGREDLTLERYQVYAYLKRLGFILMRAEHPTPEYSVAPPASYLSVQPQTIIRRFWGRLSYFVSKVMSVARYFHRINWWRRLQLDRQKTHQDVFKALRFIPCGHTIPLHCPAAKPEPSSKCFTTSPYKVFFHAFKPSTPFRKTAPPLPDFHVVVVNARMTPIPSLQELTALFGVLPEMPLPPPRKRGNAAHIKQSGDLQCSDAPPTPLNNTSHQGPLWTVASPRSARSSSFTLWTFFERILSFIPFPRTVLIPQGMEPTFMPPKPNPFLALKTGKKTIVIAAVDAGNISFFRFGQGAFEEWPMI